MTGSLPTQGASSSGGSEIYRVAPDGSPSRMWTSSNDLVYALAFDQRGRLLAGTGNRGHIFALSGEDEFTDLLKASATQVTAFAKAPNAPLRLNQQFGQGLPARGDYRTGGKLRKRRV